MKVNINSVDKNLSEVSFDTDFTGTITAGVFTASKDFSNQTFVKTNPTNELVFGAEIFFHQKKHGLAKMLFIKNASLFVKKIFCVE